MVVPFGHKQCIGNSWIDIYLEKQTIIQSLQVGIIYSINRRQQHQRQQSRQGRQQMTETQK
jgi:hypothetical protein